MRNKAFNVEPSSNMVPLALFLLFLPDVETFTAYSCDSSYKNILVYDSLSVERCSLGNDWISEEKQLEIQVLKTFHCSKLYKDRVFYEPTSAIWDHFP